MADSLVDLGIQDALRYVHVNILPSVVLLVRDISMIAVTSLTCIFFAFTLARSTSFIGAVWIFAKCGTALFSFQMVWRHVVDPFIYAKTREYVELGKRRRLPDMTGGSLFSPPSQREDPLAERRRGGGGGGAGGAGGVGGLGRHGNRGGRKTDAGGGGGGGGGGDDGGGGGRFCGALVDDLPTVSSGLRAASVLVGRRGVELHSLRDGSAVCVELRGAGGGSGEGWSEGFLCIHPHKTYETAAGWGALNWGGHQITVVPRASVEAICRGENVVIGGGGGGGSAAEAGGSVRGGIGGGGSGGGGGCGGRTEGMRTFVTPEVHERTASRFLFRLHLFGTGRDITLRSESTGTLLTTFLLGVRFDRRRVVAWHRQRSSKVLTAGVSMFTPPEGGAWEEFALSPVQRSPTGLLPVPEEEQSSACEFVICRPRDGTYWCYNGGGDEMLALTRDLSEASLFRLHHAYVDPSEGRQSKWD